jgi:serine/threonine-protein kinase
MSVKVITLQLDNVVIRLREPHDFHFLQHLGEVFCVFDEQDSGNICFGVETGSEKLFVKYAGAKTIDYEGNPLDAVLRLKRAMPVYQALRHPSLIELREHFPINEGYAAVFAWFAGECLHSHWAFAGHDKYHHPDSPSYRHKQLPLERRLDSLATVFAFHEHVALNGYVAIDFYDGSILYDFSRHITKISDIDFYEKLPYTNTMGRMWGAKRFMSPEEFEFGAAIDEITNVFTMGAIAFALLGGEVDRSFEKWEGNEALYEVACKAVSPDRSQRYASIAVFRRAWNEALG